MSELRADTITASDGTSPVTLTGQTAAKAWVNFNGTGTVAVRESEGVSSITDNGTGNYTVNFTTALSDANYAVSGSQGGGNHYPWRTYDDTQARTSSLFRALMLNASFTAADPPQVNFAIFR